MAKHTIELSDEDEKKLGLRAALWRRPVDMQLEVDVLDALGSWSYTTGPKKVTEPRVRNRSMPSVGASTNGA